MTSDPVIKIFPIFYYITDQTFDDWGTLKKCSIGFDGNSKKDFLSAFISSVHFCFWMTSNWDTKNPFSVHKKEKIVVSAGLEPRTFRLQGQRATTALKFHWWSWGKKIFIVIIQVKNWDFWKNLSFWSRMSLNFKTNFEFQFSLTFPATFSSTLSPEHFFKEKLSSYLSKMHQLTEKKNIFHISFIS